MESYGPEMPHVAPVFAGCFFLIWLIVVLAILALSIVVYCKIVSKTGYHWALGLLMLVPIANIILLLILAFGEWPIYRELNMYRHTHHVPPPQHNPPVQR